MRKSIDFIRKKGGSVILMGGKNRSERVPFDEYFDYTNSKYKSEFNDIALISGCKFFLGIVLDPPRAGITAIILFMCT